MTAPVVRELLASHAARRQRVTDDHMFTVSCDGYNEGSFRLQLFTAPGARPVAIATQTTGEGGSLTNWAEEYAAEVWCRHFPSSAEPPVWIELQLFPNSPERQERFTLVIFSVERARELTSPRCCRMSDADMARLVGAPVDRGRGQGFQPRPREPEAQPVHQVAWTVLLPRPRGMNRGCMNGTVPGLRCLVRQLFPRRQARDCCYYHSIGWHQVSAAAVRITRQAHSEGLAGEAFADRTFDLARAEDLPFEEGQALTELLSEGTGIQIGRADDGDRPRRYYINGRHRTTAMLDAGVRRTVIIRWEMPETVQAGQ